MPMLLNKEDDDIVGVDIPVLCDIEEDEDDIEGAGDPGCPPTDGDVFWIFAGFTSTGAAHPSSVTTAIISTSTTATATSTTATAERIERRRMV